MATYYEGVDELKVYLTGRVEKARPDLIIEIKYTGLDKKTYQLTLPAGEKEFEELFEETDYIGFLKLGTVWPAIKQ